jgi:hypothetical protein
MTMTTSMEWNEKDLLAELGEVESELKMLTERKEIIRGALTEIMVKRGGEKLVVEGLGTVTMTKDRTTTKYDAKVLDAFIAQCLQDGDVHTANAIAKARSESTTKGYLMVKKEW